MRPIRIVTDSSAYFIDSSIVHRYGITVVPTYVRFGAERFRLGIDLDAEAFLHRMRYSNEIPVIEAPSVDDFYQVYANLNQQTDKIISLHISKHLGDVVRNAEAASKMLLGRCDIHVIDSQTFSVGVALLTLRAAELANVSNDLDLVVRELRRMIQRVYVVFFVKSMNVLAHHELIGEAQTILGTMLGVMPFITIEEGQLRIMEKALNNSQAIDKLIEFAEEFSAVDELIILHHELPINNTVRQLQDRLAANLGATNFPTELYDGSIATFLGTDAIGIIIFESDYEDEY